MIRRPPRSTQGRSSAASDVYKRQSMIIFGSENMGRQVPSDVAQQFIALASDTDWEVQVAGFYIAYYALMMVAHMEKYGTKEEQFALISVKNHRNAMYLSLIHISEPTRLLSISYAVFCFKKTHPALTLSTLPLSEHNQLLTPP